MRNKPNFNPTVHQQCRTHLIMFGRDEWVELNECKLANICEPLTIDKNGNTDNKIGLTLLKLQTLDFCEIYYREDEQHYLVVCHYKKYQELKLIQSISQETGWTIISCPNPKAGWHRPNEYTCVVISSQSAWIDWLDEQYPDYEPYEEVFHV